MLPGGVDCGGGELPGHGTLMRPGPPLAIGAGGGPPVRTDFVNLPGRAMALRPNLSLPP